MPTTSMDDHTIAPRITMSTTSTNDLTSTIETSTYSTALDDHANEVTTIMSIATTSPEDPIHAETTTVPITSPDVHSIAPPSTSPDDHTIAETTSMSTTSSSGHSHTTMTTTTVSSTPSVTSTLILTTLASESTVASSAPVPYYAVGILATLVLLLGTLAVLMIIFYKHKRKKEKHQRNWDGEAITITQHVQ